MSSETGNLRALRLAAAGAVLLVPLASPGCGLKGDPLPPLRPQAPAAEEAPAETETTGEEREDSEAEDDEEEDGDRGRGSR